MKKKTWMAKKGVVHRNAGSKGAGWGWTVGRLGPPVVIDFERNVVVKLMSILLFDRRVPFALLSLMIHTNRFLE